MRHAPLSQAAATALAKDVIARLASEGLLCDELAEDPFEEPDQEMLDRAVAACAAWREAGLDIGISVNLSARSLLDTVLPDTVSEVLERWGLPSNRLTLEITEKHMIENMNLYREAMHSFLDLGFTFAIDDVGAGYAGLWTACPVA